MTETREQRDAREMAEAGQIASRLNALSPAEGTDLRESWTSEIPKNRGVACVELLTEKGFAHADRIRQNLAEKTIIAGKDLAEIYVIYSGGNQSPHLVQIPIYNINRQALEAPAQKQPLFPPEP